MLKYQFKKTYPISPTSEQMELTLKLIAVTAASETLTSIYNTIQNALLATKKFKYDTKYDKHERMLDNRHVCKETKTILNEKAVSMIEGLCTNPMSGSAKRYFDALGLICPLFGMADENASARADNDKIKAEWALIEACKPFTRIDLQHLYGDRRKKLLDLILNMFLGIASDEGFNQSEYLQHYHDLYTIPAAKDTMVISDTLNKAGLTLVDSVKFVDTYNRLAARKKSLQTAKY